MDNSGDNTGTIAGAIEGNVITNNSQNMSINTVIINSKIKQKVAFSNTNTCRETSEITNIPEEEMDKLINKMMIVLKHTRFLIKFYIII